MNPQQNQSDNINSLPQSPIASTASLDTSKNKSQSVILITLLVIAIAGALVYYFDIIPRINTIFKTSPEVLENSAIATQNDEVFYYLVEKRDNEGDGTWKISADYFSYDPLTKTETLLEKFDETYKDVNKFFKTDDYLYVLEYPNLNILYRVEKDNFMPFISVEGNRKITNIKILKDGKFVLITSENEDDMRAGSSNSSIDIYTSDGTTKIKSLPLKADTSIYSGWGIRGVNEEKNIAYVSYSGGDGGYSWGTEFALDLSSGKLDELGSYNVEAAFDEKDTSIFTGYRLGFLNPSATFSIYASTLNSNSVEIMIRDMVNNKFTVKSVILDTDLIDYVDVET